VREKPSAKPAGQKVVVPEKVSGRAETRRWTVRERSPEVELCPPAIFCQPLSLSASQPRLSRVEHDVRDLPRQPVAVSESAELVVPSRAFGFGCATSGRRELEGAVSPGHSPKRSLG
jgi:hypothetical protein